MSEKILHRKKQFLNRNGHHSIALILSEIKRYTYPFKKSVKVKGKNKRVKTDKVEISHDITLTLGDCSRIINLELDMYRKDSYKNSIRKLDILIEALTTLKKIMNTEWNRTEKMIKEGKAKRCY